MKIIMLAGKGNSTLYIYNGVVSSVSIEAVLLSDPVPKRKLIHGRIKKLGFFTVLNQLFFQAVIVKLIAIFSAKMITNKKVRLGLKENPLPINKLINVGFVNSETTIRILKELKPDIVIVNGTSIISQKVLDCTDAVFINTHVGITPQYRGVHGGYWALRNNDKDNFGVTIHKVDKGIDTGGIIYQDTTTIEKEDNFLTYPLYQYALAIPLLKKTIADIEQGALKTYKKKGVESRLYYHPTFTGYLYGRIKFGVK